MLKLVCIVKSMNNIYFIKTKLCASKLRSGEISDATALIHLVLSIIFFGSGLKIPIMLTPVIESGGDYKRLLFTWGVFIIITIIGLNQSLKYNKIGDGKDYFKKYSVLSLPIITNITVLMFLITLIARAIVESNTYIADINSRDLSFVMMIIFNTLYYYMLSKYMYLSSLVYEDDKQ